MATRKRPEQVADLLRAELASLLQHEVRDPGIGFVTLTSVDMSPDLTNARVYVSVLEEEREEQAMAALERAAGFLRRALAARLRLRRVPELHFRADRSLRYGARIEKILADEPPAPEPEPDGDEGDDR